MTVFLVNVVAGHYRCYRKYSSSTKPHPSSLQWRDGEYFMPDDCISCKRCCRALQVLQEIQQFNQASSVSSLRGWLPATGFEAIFTPSMHRSKKFCGY
ncbi:hypothetical protein [Mucilaginibacter sp.]|uniref:hypothetical protein n=1 Tax=Mucilaginibacter sp. TaxID=1882438 RepID=UPI002603BA37|nr:hypothetical protein [Mucilaginibacter sp.]